MDNNSQYSSTVILTAKIIVTCCHLELFELGFWGCKFLEAGQCYQQLFKAGARVQSSRQFQGVGLRLYGCRDIRRQQY